jgi:hypothetical protein
MTSFKLGDAPFVKHVGSTTIFVRSNISQTSFNNYNCGISDVHNIISIQMKGNLPSNKKELKYFRSFKNFDQEKFTEDLNKIDFDKITDQNRPFLNFCN